MIDKEKLREYAKKLMFDMKDSEYDTLQKEFDVILKQMDLIGKIDNISSVLPMFYPFELDNVKLREDVVNNELVFDDLLVNTSNVKDNQVVVPKVVE